MPQIANQLAKSLLLPHSSCCLPVLQACMLPTSPTSPELLLSPALLLLLPHLACLAGVDPEVR
jgi:hypothetical protein